MRSVAEIITDLTRALQMRYGDDGADAILAALEKDDASLESEIDIQERRLATDLAADDLAAEDLEVDDTAIAAPKSPTIRRETKSVLDAPLTKTNQSVTPTTKKKEDAKVVDTEDKETEAQEKQKPASLAERISEAFGAKTLGGRIGGVVGKALGSSFTGALTSNSAIAFATTLAIGLTAASGGLAAPILLIPAALYIAQRANFAIGAQVGEWLGSAIGGALNNVAKGAAIFVAKVIATPVTALVDAISRAVSKNPTHLTQRLWERKEKPAPAVETKESIKKDVASKARDEAATKAPMHTKRMTKSIPAISRDKELRSTILKLVAELKEAKAAAIIRKADKAVAADTAVARANPVAPARKAPDATAAKAKPAVAEVGADTAPADLSPAGLDLAKSRLRKTPVVDKIVIAAAVAAEAAPTARRAVNAPVAAVVTPAAAVAESPALDVAGLSTPSVADAAPADLSPAGLDLAKSKLRKVVVAAEPVVKPLPSFAQNMMSVLERIKPIAPKSSHIDTDAEDWAIKHSDDNEDLSPAPVVDNAHKPVVAVPAASEPAVVAAAAAQAKPRFQSADDPMALLNSKLRKLRRAMQDEDDDQEKSIENGKDWIKDDQNLDSPFPPARAESAPAAKGDSIRANLGPDLAHVVSELGSTLVTEKASMAADDSSRRAPSHTAHVEAERSTTVTNGLANRGK